MIHGIIFNFEKLKKNKNSFQQINHKPVVHALFSVFQKKNFTDTLHSKNISFYVAQWKLVWNNGTILRIDVASSTSNWEVVLVCCEFFIQLYEREVGGGSGVFWTDWHITRKKSCGERRLHSEAVCVVELAGPSVAVSPNQTAVTSLDTRRIGPIVIWGLVITLYFHALGRGEIFLPGLLLGLLLFLVSACHEHETSSHVLNIDNFSRAPTHIYHNSHNNAFCWDWNVFCPSRCFFLSWKTKNSQVHYGVEGRSFSHWIPLSFIWIPFWQHQIHFIWKRKILSPARSCLLRGERKNEHDGPWKCAHPFHRWATLPMNTFYRVLFFTYENVKISEYVFEYLSVLFFIYENVKISEYVFEYLSVKHKNRENTWGSSFLASL